MSDWISPGAGVIGDSTSKTIQFEMIKASDGSPLAGLNAASFTVSKYFRPGASAAATMTLDDLAAIDSAWASAKIKEIANGIYRFDIPDAAIAAISGGGPVAFMFLTATSLPCNFNLFVCASNADTVATTIGAAGAGLTALGDTRLANLDARSSRILDRVEYQRGHHTVTGATFYVDGVGGNDSTGDGSRSLPWKTISKALTACTSNAHDEIILLPNSAGGPTTITESATIAVTKNYVQIRGPGRDCLVTLNTGGSVFSITANGVQLSGFRIATFSGASSDGVYVNSASDFVSISKCWIESAHRDAVQFNVANRCEVVDCVIVAAGRSGVRVASGAGSGQFNLVLRCRIRDCAGYAVDLQGADASECRIQKNSIRDNAGGINISAGTLDTIFTDNRMVNNTAEITNAGTRSLIAWNFFNSEADAAITANATVISIAGDVAGLDGAAMRGTDGAITSLSGIATGTNVSDAQAAVLAKLPAALTAGGNIKADALLLNGAAPNNLAAGAQMDLVNAPNATAVTVIQANLATSANQTTILNRLGAITGSGVNTVLGFFKALLSKSATVPSDIGGTFTPTTDSTEAIAEAVAGGGTGAYHSTVTVTDGTDPIEGARVRVTQNGITRGICTGTDASGNFTFGLDSGTFTIVATAAGFIPVTTTRTVTGEEAGTLINDLEMTLIAITPPGDPTLCTVQGYVIDGEGNPKSGVEFTFDLESPAAKSSGNILSLGKISKTTDANGLVTAALARTNALVPSGKKWRFECVECGLNSAITLTGTTYDMGTLIANP
jgi:hypothetical protein